MKKTYFILIAILTSGLMHGQIFQEVSNQTFQGVFYGDCAVADFDNNGRTDFIISGAKPGYTGYSGFFKNNNGAFTENIGACLSQIMYSSIAVGDLNGDNKKDIIITGTKTGENSSVVFEIYYNNGDGTFTKNENSGIPGVNFGSVQIADMTNDGIADIIVNGNLGSEYITKVYQQNEGGTFTDLNAGLMGTYFSAIKAFDANSDGINDLLVTGFSTNFTPETKLYINSGTGTFTEKPITIPGIYFSSIDALDINNDSHLDLLISGTDYTPTTSLTIYTNDGFGNFTAQANNFTGIYNGNTKFVDYNKDGLIDIFAIGSNAAGDNTVLLYKNNLDGTYTEDTVNSASIVGVNMSKGEWLDFDNDGDLDLLTIGFEGADVAQTRLYRNSTINQETCGEPGNNTGDLGCVTFNYEGTSVTYITVRGSDGNVWLQQNLGSASVATSQNDEASYGDLFQWGRWDDGHQKRNSALGTAPTPNNPAGLATGNDTFYTGWWSPNALSDKWEAATPAAATEINGCDPCKALGNGWKLPTEAEWTAIKDSQNISNPATAFQSVLKLPVSGYRAASGSFSFVGTRGYFWSSTTSSSGAKYFYVGTTIANPSAGAPRSQSAAIRCLKYPQASSYCNASVDFDVEPITMVNFSDINNLTSETVNGTPAYEDFTAIVGNVVRGNTYQLTVKGNTVGQFEHDIRAFFDWNKDGVFDMQTEYYPAVLTPSTGIDAIEATVSITIPATATIGDTRMRVIKDQWNVYEEGEFDACLNAYYGQIEDYTINIQESLGTIDFNKNDFKLYPNPTEGIINIQANQEIKSITIYNHLGQLIATQKASQINIANLSSGIYMIRVDFENGQTATKKVVKK
ncbi:hypothetical protein GGR22_001074 [Flavobacterium gossypii]|uniref:T9SS type A sorting domain-containing protein n=1 Tax=Flavobacterium gossypii TaxID=1646119 RepID=A0ABR6DMP5_9FLAO|nr:FG-GAP-like repeat-containing protein [Flavobacterium gossypii]MBA9072948.1 hypothetical protein [Flavobacterium gossypii]